MPRSSSSSSRSSSSYRSSYKPSYSSYSYHSPKSIVLPSKTAAPTPAPVAPTSISHYQEKERPGFFSNMWQGFGLGAGQAIAHNIFRSNPVVTHTYEPTPTETKPKEYEKCLQEHKYDKHICEEALMKYNECLKVKDNEHKNLCKELSFVLQK